MKAKPLILLSVMAAWILVLMGTGSSCKKNKEINLNPALTTLNDNLLAYRAFTHCMMTLIQASADADLIATGHGTIDSASVTYDSISFLFTFTYDGKLCTDSVVRNGMFSVDLDGNMYKVGTRGKITFSGYSEDGHLISGTDSLLTHENVWDVYGIDRWITDAVITKDSVRNILLDMDLEFLVDARIPTQGNLGLPVRIEGISAGISSVGAGFSSAVTSTLYGYFDCPWIREGFIAVAMPSGEVSPLSVHFMGDTGCTDRVDYQLGGTVYHRRINEAYLKY